MISSRSNLPQDGVERMSERQSYHPFPHPLAALLYYVRTYVRTYVLAAGSASRWSCMHALLLARPKRRVPRAAILFCVYIAICPPHPELAELPGEVALPHKPNATRSELLTTVHS